MSDLIERVAVLEDLEKRMADDYVDATRFAEYIRTLPSAELERKWIPVTEGLPWNDTNTLVTVRDDSGDTPWEYTSVGWRTPDGQYWVVDNEICYGVTAWMPLPEPMRR